MHSYCTKLPFGILSPYSYLNIETMNIISSDTKITKKLSAIPEKNDFTKVFEMFVNS